MKMDIDFPNEFRVLVADDDPVLLSFYEEVLSTETQSLNEMQNNERSGLQAHIEKPVFDLTLCRQSEEAVEQVKQSVASGHPFAIVFLDLYMPPGPDGIWAAEQIRVLDSHVEILMVTAHTDKISPDFASRVLPVHKIFYLQKPLHPQEVSQFAMAISAKWVAEKKLEDAKKELEKRVVKRTFELSRANLDLKRDIERREKVEKELVQLATAIHQVSEGVIITDKDGTIQYINPAVESITGYSKKDLCGQKTIFLLSDHHEKIFYKKIWREISTGRVWKGPIVTRKKNGSTCDLAVIVSPIRDEQKKIIGFVSLNRDVTHERHIERKLLQAQKMEAIGTLAGGIAHDFNNLLMTIMINTEYALKKLKNQQSISEGLKLSFKASKLARDLVNQILTFSRQDQQKLQTLNLIPVLKESLKMIRSSLPTTIEIRQDIQVPFAPVLATPDQIQQVIINLCSNAKDAMRDTGGVLTVSLSEAFYQTRFVLKSSELKPGAYFKLSVKDTGHGMTPEIMDKIFDPFFTTKNIREGTGMGLSAVHGIIESLNSIITVNSNPGKGTEFIIFLPQSEKERSKPAKTSLTPVRGSERLLVVDDDAPLLESLDFSLTRLGYQVTSVSSSMDALDLVKKDPKKYELIITDQTMPGMTGFELAKEILEICPEIPIILCTGYSDSVSPEKAAGAGIREFLNKPVIISELTARMKEIFAKEGPL